MVRPDDNVSSVPSGQTFLPLTCGVYPPTRFCHSQGPCLYFLGEEGGLFFTLILRKFLSVFHLSVVDVYLLHRWEYTPSDDRSSDEKKIQEPPDEERWKTDIIRQREEASRWRDRREYGHHQGGRWRR